MADSTRKSIWIPNEIVQLIAQYLRIKPTYHLALACRRFYAILIDELYNKALIQDEQRGSLFRTLIELRLRNSTTTYASLLKKVDNINHIGVHISECKPPELCQKRLKVDEVEDLPFFDPGIGTSFIPSPSVQAPPPGRNFTSSTLLHVLAALGDDEGMRLLLETRDDVDMVFGYPLLSATVRGHEAAVKRLLEAGIDPNEEFNDKHPILLAIRFNRTHLIPLLLQHNADLKRCHRFKNLFIMACQDGALQTAKYIYALLLKQADDDYRLEDSLDIGLHTAIVRNNASLAEWIISIRKESVFKIHHGKGLLESLPKYCGYGHKRCSDKIALALLDNGGGDNTTLKSLLQIVTHIATHGYHRVIRRIFEIHPDKVEYLTSQAWAGRTALSRAVSHRQEDCVKYLIEMGSDVKQPDHRGLSILDIAVLSDKYVSERLATILIEAGVDINIRNVNYDGSSTLHRAIAARQTDAAILLIKAGADLTARTTAHGIDRDVQLRPGGHIPLHLAMYHGNTRVVDCLLEAGVDVEAVDNAGITPEDIQRGDIGRWIELAQVASKSMSPEHAKRKYKLVLHDTNPIHLRELPLYPSGEDSE